MATKTGILRPFRFGTDHNPVMGSGDDLRESRITCALGTRRAGARIMGELQWRHYFGSRLETMRQSNLNETRQALTYVYATEALQSALPDEVIDRINLTYDDKLGAVDMTIFTRLRRDTTKRNTISPTIKVKRT